MGLEDLKFSKLVFSLTAIDKIFFPYNLKGNIFRGAFGLTFKRLNCRTIPICSERCIDSNCLYRKIFEPHISDYAPSGLRDIPRPFIITYTDDEREIIYPGESFNIGFNLFGWACDYYAHFIQVIEEIGKEGIGPLRGKYFIRSVFSENLNGDKELIMSSEKILKEVIPFKIKLNDDILSPYVKIELKTPTSIKYNEEYVTQPEFYHLFLRIRDRISAIAYFHNGVELFEDFKLLELESREVKTIKSNWTFKEVKRRSSKTRQVHNLSGITGYAIYDFSDLDRVKTFYPWLKIAEITNIGKNSVWGMGAIKTIFNWKIKKEIYT